MPLPPISISLQAAANLKMAAMNVEGIAKYLPKENTEDIQVIGSEEENMVEVRFGNLTLTFQHVLSSYLSPPPNVFPHSPPHTHIDTPICVLRSLLIIHATTSRFPTQQLGIRTESASVTPYSLFKIVWFCGVLFYYRGCHLRPLQIEMAMVILLLLVRLSILRLFLIVRFL